LTQNCTRSATQTRNDCTAERIASWRWAVAIEASPDARRLGLSIWIHTRQLQPGTPWQEQLEDAIIEKFEILRGLRDETSEATIFDRSHLRSNMIFCVKRAGDCRL
jgi:hypothetical protein